jgi:hypothetical protein
LTNPDEMARDLGRKKWDPELELETVVADLERWGTSK